LIMPRIKISSSMIPENPLPLNQDQKELLNLMLRLRIKKIEMIEPKDNFISKKEYVWGNCEEENSTQIGYYFPSYESARKYMKEAPSRSGKKLVAFWEMHNGQEGWWLYYCEKIRVK